MKNVALKSTLLILAILLHATMLTNPLSFHMASFEPSPLKAELDLSGDAAISSSGSALQLNRGATNSSGRALYHKAMQLWAVNGSTTQMADFSTLFFINVSSAGSSSVRDGAVSFLLLPPGSAWHPENRGGSLGSPTSSAGQENRIVAVEFDLGPDPRPGHFGIDVSSTKSQTYVNVSGGIVNKGVAYVCVDYDSRAKNLSASLGLSGSLGSYHVSYVVDLSVVLPEKVQIGFTAKTGTTGYVEIHQVLSWSFSSSLQEEEEISVVKLGLRTIVLVVMVAVLVLVLVVIVTVFILRKKLERSLRRRHCRTDTTTGSSGSIEIEIVMDAAGPKKFSYFELSKATNNFGPESKIGEGGFGCVYRGRLITYLDRAMDVAIKRWKSRLDDQGKTELLKEMIVMSKTRHRNLVKLIGWCEEEGGDLLLVFEFIPNGTLAQHLFIGDQGGDNSKKKALDWGKRYEIARRLASGLEYLHEGLDQYVVHRDIKASNVMLDYDYNPKLGDFGLARFTDHGKSMNVSNVAGTYGYMDPELIMTGSKYSKHSDVYSFGILALEIATGIKATDLALSVRNLYNENAPLERVFGWIDPSLGQDYNGDEARRLLEFGFRCCNPISASRPSMTHVMNALTIGVGASTSGQAASYQRTATI